MVLAEIAIRSTLGRALSAPYEPPKEPTDLGRDIRNVVFDRVPLVLSVVVAPQDVRRFPDSRERGEVCVDWGVVVWRAVSLVVL